MVRGNPGHKHLYLQKQKDENNLIKILPQKKEKKTAISQNKKHKKWNNKSKDINSWNRDQAGVKLNNELKSQVSVN